jgi:hypothetical protein
MYAIKNFKKFKGHEGETLTQGSLHRLNVKVAEWSEDAHGGSLRLDFVHLEEENKFLGFTKKYLAERVDFDGAAYDLSAPPWSLRESAMLSMSMEHEEALNIARLCKKGICYRAMVVGKPQICSINMPYTASRVAQLKDREGDALIEIFNETLNLPLIDEAVANLNLQNARYKKMCAKAILFTRREPDGSIVTRQVNEPYSVATVAKLRTRIPGLVEIINERYL